MANPTIKAMSKDETQKELARLRTLYANLTTNLIALRDLLTYQRLAGEGGLPKPQLKGRSAVEVPPAIEEFDALFPQYLLLMENLEAAEKLFGEINLLNRDEKLQAIAELLQGASIKLPAVQVDLADRDLLDPAEITGTITPDRLLEVMNGAYKKANKIVHEVDAVWKNMRGKFKTAETDIQTLRLLAKELGSPDVSELDGAERALNMLKNEVDTNPLECKDTFDSQVQPAIALARARLDQMKQERDGISQGLATARTTTLVELKAAHTKAKEEFARRAEKVIKSGVETLPQPLPDNIVDELEAWLGRLDHLLAQGKWTAASVGLRNWNAQASTRKQTCDSVYTAHNALIERRYELRGLLESLRAMASRSTLLAEDPTVTRLHDSANTLLYTRPTDLDAAELAVAAYTKAVRN